jgi:hypothetical protein
MYNFAQWMETTWISETIKSVTWIVPLVQSIHIVTLAIVFGAIFMVALRVLGMVRMDQGFGAVLNRFEPFIRKGIVVLAATGLILVAGEPVRELMSLSFWLKMALLLIGITSAYTFTRSLGRAGVMSGGEPQFTSSTRVGAMATVVLWLAIIFLGRAIAYDVEVWGGWSLSPRA